MAISDYEIFKSSGRELSGMFAENTIKVKEFSESSGYGVRAITDKRVGFAYCSTKKEIKTALESAAKLAKFSPVSTFSFQEKRQFKKLKSSDSKIAELEESEMKDAIAQVADAIKSVKARPRVYFSAGTEETSLENSAGFSGSYTKTGITIYAEATSGKGYGFGYLSSISLPKDFSIVGRDAAEMVTAMKNPKKASAGTYTVVFTQEAFHSLLEVFMPSLSGDWKRRDISKLAESIGKKIFSEELSMYDDGTLNASGIQPFDDEGVPSAKRTIVENGVLKRFIYNGEIAALEGVSENGFCSREDYAAPPSLSSSNLEISPGDYKNFEDELGDFILVKSLHGTHTSNMTTGDFGVEVNVAFHMKNGKSTPMRGFIISENIFNLFTRIKAIEKDQKTHENLVCPRMAFENVKVVS